MPAALMTFWSLPPQPPVCRVFGFSSNDCQISVSSPHLAQRYRYVGMVLDLRGVALEGV
jgi:hypothetical protein